MSQSRSDELMDQLQMLAVNRSIPFCYSCYERAPSGRCPKCGSDDLARELVGEGVDWGTEWIVPILVHDAVEPIDVQADFEESVRQCYPETTKIGWLEYDTATAIRTLDPLSWGLACSEWIDFEVSAGNLMSLNNGSTYYATDDIERFLAECEQSEQQ